MPEEVYPEPAEGLPTHTVPTFDPAGTSVMETAPEISPAPDPEPEPIPVQPSSPPPASTGSYLPPTSDAVPATLPASASSPLPLNFIVLGIAALFIVVITAAAAFFFIQSRNLKSQLGAINTTIEQRQVSPTPSAETTPQPTDSATPTDSPSPEPAEGTPTDTLSQPPHQLAFTSLDKIFTQAKDQSATSQLLMITNNNLLDPSSPFRYWFRRQPGTRSYFLIEKPADADAKLFTQANVTPDNSIPDLNSQYDQKTLGLDAAAAYNIALTQVVAAYAKGTSPESVSAKYLTTSPTNKDTAATNLWQLIFKFPASSKLADGVVQVDAVKSTVVFTNLPQK